MVGVEYSERRRGIPAARAYLSAATYSLQRYEQAQSASASEPSALMLYYGGFFVFCRGAVQALEKSDGRADPILGEAQSKFYRDMIAKDAVHILLKAERDAVAHGDDGWAAHPHNTMAMLDRFFDAGFTLAEKMFEGPVWPDGPFKGRPVVEIMWVIRDRVSHWLDELDARDEVARR